MNTINSAQKITQQKPSAVSNYFAQKSQKLLNSGRLVFYATMVIATLAFSQQAFSQGKNAGDAKQDSTKAKQKTALFVPLTFVARLGPFPYIVPNQVYYYGRFNEDGTAINLENVNLSDGSLVAGFHHMTSSKSGNTTTTDGLSFKYSKASKALDSANVSVLGRVSTVKQPDGKQSALTDGQLTIAQPWGTPVIVTAGSGTNDNYVTASAGNSSIIATLEYRRNATVGIIQGLGLDIQVPYTTTFSQRVYASGERNYTSGVVSYNLGSRLFAPIGTVECDYWGYSNHSFWKGDMAIRLSVIIN